MMFEKLSFSFDVGHSSIGWAVFKPVKGGPPDLLGCGTVIFPGNDCLVSRRRLYRRQRRHLRATRLRIARLARLLVYLNVLTGEQIQAPACAWPWLLAAQVLRGVRTLTWPELWDVLRWYAHNRGYDGNKGWSRQEAVAPNEEDTEKEKRAHELLDRFEQKYRRPGTMAEVFCDALEIDPLGAKTSSTLRFRDLGAAFPREGVEKEVELILRAHIDRLPQVHEAFIAAIMSDHTALPGPDYRFPARYGQRLQNGLLSPGGILFGQLIPRFENRIIARCPVAFQRIYTAALKGRLKEPMEIRRFASALKKAAREHPEQTEEEWRETAAEAIAEVASKVPSADGPEFYRYRWAMQVANVAIAVGDAGRLRSLTLEERAQLTRQMECAGAMTPSEFKKAVRAITGEKRDNLEQMLSLPDADKALVLDPARKLAQSGVLGLIWPHAGERLQRHLLTALRRGKALIPRQLLEQVPEAQASFDHWWDGEAMKRPRKKAVVRTRDQVLDTPCRLEPASGRAPFARQIMREVWCDVFERGIHPANEGGVLYRSEAIRRAQLQRALDAQTNNHLVRHRLKILERLHEDMLKAYAGADRSRVGRMTIEVNRDLREMSGKDIQEQSKEQRLQTLQFRSVEKKLKEKLGGLGVHIGPGLIRKGRIAEDLGWKCPYTGACFDEPALLHRKVDKDHIIPRSQRASDSLDSLAITFAEVNRWKGNRTARRFVEEEQGKPVPGLPNIHVKTLAKYLADVEALETFRGHDDDRRRKRKRKKLLQLGDYVEKEFTPGDLTRTSQLVRLGSQVLQKQYLDLETPPVVTALPGSVTGVVRKSWNLTGCLVKANQLVLNPEEPDEEGKPTVRKKSEIRGITHLHHALDACILGLVDALLPRDGKAWQLLVKRRLNREEQAQAKRLFGSRVSLSADGRLHVNDLTPSMKNAIAEKLAERRVVQHIPRDLSGMDSQETVWRVFDPTDPHPNAKRLGRWLAQAKVTVPAAEAGTALIICRKRKNGGDDREAGGKVFRQGGTWRWIYDIRDKGALLGFAPEGDPEKAKLKRLKAVKVFGSNYGIALDPEVTLIRPHKLWHQLERLRRMNGGKPVRVLRIGSLVRVPRKSARSDYRGVWMVRGVQLNQARGCLIDLSPADQINYRGAPGCFRDVSLKTLLDCGLEVLKPSYVGIPVNSETDPPE